MNVICVQNIVEMSLQISYSLHAVKNDDFFIRTAYNEKKKIIRTNSFDTLKPYTARTLTSILSHYILKNTKIVLVFTIKHTTNNKKKHNI